MSSAAAAAISQSAGHDVPVPGQAGDGGPGGLSKLPGLPSGRLDGLKKERSDLRTRLSRLQEARAELEEPGIELQRLEAGRQAVEADTAAALSMWAQQGCEGQRPATNPERMAVLARQKQATQQAIDANAEAVLELARQQAALRQKLAGIDSEIAAEAAAILAAGLESELADVQAAADKFNAVISRVMGLRSFLLRPGGCYAFSQLAERISQLKSPELGSTRAETEQAAKEWARRFAELTK